jgi:hypothetical protein
MESHWQPEADRDSTVPALSTPGPLSLSLTESVFESSHRHGDCFRYTSKPGDRPRLVTAWQCLRAAMIVTHDLLVVKFTK